MSRLPVVAAFCALLSLPIVAEAQTARPGVDCSLLTAQQAGWDMAAGRPGPHGLPCVAPPKGDPPATPSAGGFVPSAETCNPRPNPYTDQDKAAACAIWDQQQRPTPALPVYEVGASYLHPYSGIKMIVLAIGSSLEGVPVVTAQYTAGDDLVGQVFAFKVTQGVPWTKPQ